MNKLNRRNKRIIVFFLDIVIVALANIIAAYFVTNSRNILSPILVMVIVQIVGYVVIGNMLKIFSQANRFFDFMDFVHVLLSTSASSLLTLLVMLSFNKSSLSINLILLAWLLSSTGIGLSRQMLRLIVEYLAKEPISQQRYLKTLVIGAGQLGELLVTQLNNYDSDYQVVGFVDDDNNKSSIQINRLPVLGKIESLPDLVDKYSIDVVVLAIHNFTGLQRREIVRLLADKKVEIRIYNIERSLQGIDETVRVDKIKIEDLLERDETVLDTSMISGEIKDQVVLISGAGGSIGSELVRQISLFQPRRILMLGHGENSIYQIDHEMQQQKNGIDYQPIIGDVQNRALMFDIMRKYQPDIVYHAAAHKHVPLMEMDPRQAILNNVIGSMNIAQAAKANFVKSFVMISTDKAVNPTSVMGASKRMAELIVTNLNGSGSTKFTVTRFGNVLGSRGSVVPLFKQQILAGGPITITDKRMTRYFMSIPEAARLVIQSSVLARSGELFVLDMGQPVKIYDLAERMIQFSGTLKKIDIVEVGLRPGEKLYEELIADHELSQEHVYDNIKLGKITRINAEEVVNYAKSLLALPKEEMQTQMLKFTNTTQPTF
ncbi:MAG: polysaccharide biosynthesis protein [Streptococcaceae bacterium]|jgi:FlaA1/EpsC-like NDP-sugar epimerase|nr:polysaccharide biosynthesis protein [Streptococcaceae bacterium]